MKITEVSRFSIRVYNAVIKLLPQLSEGTELPSREHIKAILKSRGTHLFIAELDDNQIIGMMTISTYGIPTGTKVWIEDVVVDDSQRGKGFGKELIMFAIDYTRSIDAKTIDLTSKPSRIAANRLYHMTGFVLRKTNVYRFTLK
jgi:ribosomal protein S18 acetylase RimI-like enzyme